MTTPGAGALKTPNIMGVLLKSPKLAALSTFSAITKSNSQNQEFGADSLSCSSPLVPLRSIKHLQSSLESPPMGGSHQPAQSSVAGSQWRITHGMGETPAVDLPDPIPSRSRDGGSLPISLRPHSWQKLCDGRSLPPPPVASDLGRGRPKCPDPVPAEALGEAEEAPMPRPWSHAVAWGVVVEVLAPRPALRPWD